jgi:hypothetical protein
MIRRGQAFNDLGRTLFVRLALTRRKHQSPLSGSTKLLVRPRLSRLLNGRNRWTSVYM